MPPLTGKTNLLSKLQKTAEGAEDAKTAHAA
jgi:hypothetical protein